MGKGKKLIVLLVVVVVLLGGYFAASYFFRDQDDEDTSDDDSAAIAINAIQQDEIAGIQYNYGDEVITLVKEGDQWYLEEDKNFPVQQSVPEMISSDAADLKARRLISSDSADFSEYGLDSPTSAYVFTKTDGTNITFFIGNYNNFGGTYYLNVAGTNEIYLIEGDFLDDFDVGKSELADVPEIETASTDQVTGLRLTLDGKTTVLTKYTNGLDTAYSGSLEWFVDKDTPADTVALHDYIGKAVDYSSNGCAAYKANASQIEAYGLNEPVLKLALQYTDSEEKDTGEKNEDGVAVTETVETPRSLVLLVGKQSPDGTYYAKLDSSDTVYLLNADYPDSLRDFDLSTLRAADVCKLSSDEVTGMDVTLNKKTYKIRIERDENDSNRYTIDGTQITAVKFNDFFSSIQSAVSDGFAAKETDSDDVIRIVYHTNRSGFETLTLSIAPYDRNLYVTHLNEGDGVLIDKDVFEKIQASFEALMND